MTGRPAKALAGAAACVAGAVAVWAASFHVSRAAHLDTVLLTRLGGAFGADAPGDGLSPRDVVALVNPKPFALGAELLVGIALLRRRVRLALAVGAVLLLANATSQVLKELLAAPRNPSVDPAAWPSGHATAAMSLALCLVLVVPARHRRWAALAGAAFVAAVASSIVMAGDHLASDVAGGVLVAGAFSALAVAALHVTDRHRARWAALAAAVRSPAGLQVAALVAAAGLVARADQVVELTQRHTKFAVAAVAIALAGVALTALRSAAAPRGAGRLIRAPGS